MMRLGSRYWKWLGGTLQLTLGGRIVFTLVAGLGLLGVIGDDTTGGDLGPNEAAVLGFYVLLMLLVILGADWVFRLGRSGARRLLNHRSPG